MNAVYEDIANPLEVVAGEIPCDSLWLSSRSGVVKRVNGCHFEFTPVSPKFIDPLKDESGKVILTISRIGNKDTIPINSVELKAKSIPTPTVRIAWKSGGFIKGSVLKTQAGIIAYFDCAEGKFPVTTFALTLLKKSGTWIRLSAKGPYFSDQMKSLLQTIESGDRILISEVKAQSPYQEEVELQPIQLTVE